MRVLALVLVLGGCSRSRSDPAPPPDPPRAPEPPAAVEPPPAPAPVPTPEASAPAAATCGTLFEPPAGAKQLCSEHVLASGSEIHWTSWQVTTSRMETFQAYATVAGACGAGTTSKPPILSVAKGDRRLSIHAAAESGYPRCDKAASPGTVVVVISQRYTR